MIAAIRYRVNVKCTVLLYATGSYSDVDWTTEETCKLGEKYSVFAPKKDCSMNTAIMVKRGLNEVYSLRLLETKRYTLKLDCDSSESYPLPHFQNQSNKYLKCDKDKDTLLFQFVNYLGRTKIVFNDGSFIPLEIVPEKMDYEDDYIRLTESLADICAGLLLEYTGATSNQYQSSGDSAKTLLEQFIFLRKFCYEENLLGLFEIIKRNPDRILVSEEMFKPLGYGVPSKKFYKNPFSYGKRWGNASKGISSVENYLPSEVSVTRKYDNMNTPANRFVKFALQRFDDICVDLLKGLTNNGQIQQLECYNEATTIHETIEEILRDSFFDQIGILEVMPKSNQVLQKREGYNQIFTAYSMVNLALQLDWRGKEDIYEGESKNVALLYEYWLFFELYKVIKSIDGCILSETKESSFISYSKDGLSVSLKEGQKACQCYEIPKWNMKVNLYYNRTFSGKEFQSTQYEGSYSRPFRPDYTIALFPASYTAGSANGEVEAIKNGAVSYIHFDAKYRITDLTSFIGKANTSADDEEEIEEDKIGSIVNTYKRGDLLKMHTYNDAIRRTIGSYVLYPGVSESKSTFKVYDEILPGIGAFSIKPSNTDASENALCGFISSLIEAKYQRNSRLNRLGYYSEMIIREPAVAFLDNRKEKSAIIPIMNDSCVVGYIRSEKENDYYWHLQKSGLLFNGSEFLFYFYAIKGKFVYVHHKDIFVTTSFRFYCNNIIEDKKYKLEAVLCEIESNELISKHELVERLNKQGFITTEDNHSADFYYVLKLKVVDDSCEEKELSVKEVDGQNGNDSYSPHSPKIVNI